MMISKRLLRGTWSSGGEHRPAGRAVRLKWAVSRIAIVGLVVLGLAGCGTSADRSTSADDTLSRWTQLADYYGQGTANWRTLAIMHRAMHDALNAAQPVYARWAPAAPDEPPSAGASPSVAMTAAAYQVLIILYPDRQYTTERNFRTSLGERRNEADPAHAATEAAIRLGKSIGLAALRRRADDGLDHTYDFPGSDLPGRWRPTPPGFATSATSKAVPFLFKATSDVPFVPPPALGSPTYLQQLDETRRLGAAEGSQRTRQQTDSAFFWAHQSSQRGFLRLALQLLADHPPPGGLHEQTRIMSQLTSALADSAILVWTEKEQFSFWRPVTAIRAADNGSRDVNWSPVVETPPFPEYPSGHAADCYIGAGVLRAAFPALREPIVYVALNTVSSAGTGGSFGMGQHAQGDPFEDPERRFPSLDTAAEDCSLSRIWSGAHFRAAEDESKRVADIIVDRALKSVRPLSSR